MKKAQLEEMLNLKGASLKVFEDYEDGTEYTISLSSDTTTKIKNKIGACPSVGGRIFFEGKDGDAEISSAAKTLIKTLEGL